MIKFLGLLVFITWSFTSATAVFASAADGTIETNYKYAWGENLDWLNFGCDTCNVHITDSTLTGYVWSRQFGWINLAPLNGGVTNNCSGQLGGYAWSTQLGWIDFSGVTINSSGKFSGVSGVSTPTAGKINFSCTNCDVRTDWRPCNTRAVCGDGIIDSGEACDSGVNNGVCPKTCSTSCAQISCGGGGGGGGGGTYIPPVASTTVSTTTVTMATTTTTMATTTVAGTSVCNGADFNHDYFVNSIDFSILLAFWKTNYPYKNPCVDINGDKKVNSVDFSILLYQWNTRR